MGHEQTKAFKPENVDMNAMRNIAEGVMKQTHDMVKKMGSDGLFTSEAKEVFNIVLTQLKYSEGGAPMKQMIDLSNKVIDLLEKDKAPLGVGFMTLFNVLRHTWTVYHKRVLANTSGESAEEIINEALNELGNKIMGKNNGNA